MRQPMPIAPAAQAASAGVLSKSSLMHAGFLRKCLKRSALQCYN